jgi:ribosomal protein L11 methylase PrmA
VRLFREGLGDLLVPDGALILSGILAEQVVEVQEAAEEHGFHLIDYHQAGDWVALGNLRNSDY